jgi:hypothetical protein
MPVERIASSKKLTAPTDIPSEKERYPSLLKSLKNLMAKKTVMGVIKYPKTRFRLVGSE